MQMKLLGFLSKICCPVDHVFYFDDWVFNKEFALEKIKNHFDVSGLKGFGIMVVQLVTLGSPPVISPDLASSNKFKSIYTNWSDNKVRSLNRPNES